MKPARMDVSGAVQGWVWRGGGWVILAIYGTTGLLLVEATN